MSFKSETLKLKNLLKSKDVEDVLYFIGEILDAKTLKKDTVNIDGVCVTISNHDNLIGYVYKIAKQIARNQNIDINSFSRMYSEIVEM